MRKWSKFIFTTLFTVSMIAFQSSYYFQATSAAEQTIEELQKYEEVQVTSELTKPTPVATPSNEVIRIGDEVQIRVSGLDIVAGADNYVSHISYEWFTEKWMPNRVLESIEVPYVTATGIDGEDYNVEVFHMTISGGRYWVSDPFRVTSENLGHTITRADMMPYLEEHDGWPSTMYLLFDGVPKSVTGEPGPSFTPKDMEYTFHGDLVFNYKITEEPPYSEDTYDYFSGEYEYVIKKQSDDSTVASDVVKQTAFLWYETSDISIIADKSENLEPGEEVELTFTIYNPSEIKNNLTMDLVVDGLELVEGSEDNVIDLSAWKLAAGKFSLPIIDLANDWLNINENETISFTQKFRISEDFTGKEITLSPALTAVNKDDFDFNNDLILKMKSKDGEETNPGPGKPLPDKPTSPEKPKDAVEETLPKTGESTKEKVLSASMLVGISMFVLRFFRK